MDALRITEHPTTRRHTVYASLRRCASYDASRRLGLPKSTLENWVRAEKKGVLGEVGKSHRPLTDVERELAQLKRELAQVKMERDILKKAAAYFDQDGANVTVRHTAELLADLL